MRDIWKKLEAQFEPISGALDDLRPGASLELIPDAEAALDTSLPDDFRDSVRIHDGQYGNSFLIGTYRLYPLQKSLEIATPKQGLLSRLLGTRATPARRLAIADDGGSSELYLELETGPTFGAVRYVWEDGDSVVFASFRQLLEAASRDINDGVLRYDDESRGFLNAANPEDGWPSGGDTEDGIA